MQHIWTILLQNGPNHLRVGCGRNQAVLVGTTHPMLLKRAALNEMVTQSGADKNTQNFPDLPRFGTPHKEAGEGRGARVGRGGKR